MLLWFSLSVFFLAVFFSVLLVWRRFTNVKRARAIATSILQGIDPAQPHAPVAHSLVEATPAGRFARLTSFRRRRDGDPAAADKTRMAVIAAVMAIAGMAVGFRFRDVLGPAAIFIFMGVFAAIPLFVQERRKVRRMLTLEEQFPEALDFLARSVRAGNALSVSLELLCREANEPLRAEFVRVTRELVLGASLESALNDLIRRVPLIEVRFFVSAVLLQRDTGGNLSEILSKLAHSVRERLRLRGQVKAVSGQGRLTAAILSVLPVITMILLKVISPAYLNGLIDEPLGRDVLAAAVVSQIIGFLVMRKIVRVEV